MRTTMIFAMAALALTLPAPVHAFCGFYVAGSDQEMVNDATMVVLMREGSRTVLSMQNHYEGPPENFAMVIPVPVVLEEDHVKVLKNEVFERIDHLAAPRLVEYWEQDPCYVEPDYEEDEAMEDTAAAPVEYAAEGAGSMGVTVEAEFTVGEYDIVILSAEDSSGLDAWLRDNEYAIPEGAEPVLRPYVEQGMKFFVAKVAIERVTFDDRQQVVLSPLRFHYDSELLSLPIRLGLLNADGSQDVVVHVLGRGVRYEVVNYDNYAIPTNLTVTDEVREARAKCFLQRDHGSCH